MKAPVTWMAKNHVAANLLMGFVLLSGLFTMLMITLVAFQFFYRYKPVLEKIVQVEERLEDVGVYR